MVTPLWRLSSFYFLYFASIGALVPYWSFYLKDLGFSSLEIGQLFSTLALSKIVAPYLWGWIADKTGFHIRIVRITSFLAICCFIPLIWSETYWSILSGMLVFSFFWNAALPQFEVITLNRLGENRHRYSQIRLWGSLGFIFTVVVFGALFEWIALDWLPLLLVIIFFFIWATSMTIAEASPRISGSVNIFSVLRKPQVVALLLACFLMQASHGPYYTFFTIYMQELEYQSFSIGLLWSLGVAAEVLVFMVMHRIMKRIHAARLMMISLLLTSVRWVLTAIFPENIFLIVLAQCLHAASFGVFHASAIHMIHEFFPNHQGRGQALYASVSFGAGGAIGSLYSGFMWDFYAPMTTFLVAAGIALLGAGVSYFIYQRRSALT